MAKAANGRYHLRTLGYPELRRRGERVSSVRLDRQDLALLIYFCIEEAKGKGTVARGRPKLAMLLEREEEGRGGRSANESTVLSQSIYRIRQILPDAIEAGRGPVTWLGGLSCDAADLLRRSPADDPDPELLPFYESPFLEGWEFQYQANEFSVWADEERRNLEVHALLLLEAWGARAEAQGDWRFALEVGKRMGQISSLESEMGERRVMRALDRLGLTRSALARYERLRELVRIRDAREPEAETRALAEELRRKGG